MSTGSRIRVAAIMRNERDEVLLVRQFHRGSPFWTFPGGAPEGTESPQAAIVREVAEETGYSISVGGVVGVGSLHTDRWEAPKLEYFFATRALSHEEPGRSAGETIIESRFFDVNDFPADFRPREAEAFLVPRPAIPYVEFVFEEALE